LVKSKYGYISAAAPVQHAEIRSAAQYRSHRISVGGLGHLLSRRRIGLAARDDRDVEAAAAAHEFGRRGTAQPRAPTDTLRFADHDSGDVAQACIFEQRVGGRRAVERHGFGAQRFG
jgi:hypothetical protein